MSCTPKQDDSITSSVTNPTTSQTCTYCTLSHTYASLNTLFQRRLQLESLVDSAADIVSKLTHGQPLERQDASRLEDTRADLASTFSNVLFAGVYHASTRWTALVVPR